MINIKNLNYIDSVTFQNLYDIHYYTFCLIISYYMFNIAYTNYIFSFLLGIFVLCYFLYYEKNKYELLTFIEMITKYFYIIHNIYILFIIYLIFHTIILLLLDNV